MKLEVVADSIEGRPRQGKQENQDSYHVDTDNHIYIVADGMGGAPGGDIASSTAVSLLHRNLFDLIEYDRSHPLPAEDFSEAMRSTVKQVNAIVTAASKANVVAQTARGFGTDHFPERLRRIGEDFHSSVYDRMDGMATTLDGLVLRGSEAYFVHVGDGRVYHLSRELEQVSHDHIEPSLADAMIEPFRTVAQSRLRPTSMVGLSNDIEIETGRFSVRPGEGFLLCTDGVSKTVAHYELTNFTKGFSRLQENISATIRNPGLMSDYHAMQFGGERDRIRERLASGDDATYIAARRKS